jgi:hypothetical protein
MSANSSEKDTWPHAPKEQLIERTYLSSYIQTAIVERLKKDGIDFANIEAA